MVKLTVSSREEVSLLGSRSQNDFALPGDWMKKRGPYFVCEVKRYLSLSLYKIGNIYWIEKNLPRVIAKRCG